MAPVWACSHCRQLFDTFETHATCPHCSLVFETTACPDCSRSHPMGEWATAVPSTTP